MKTYALFGLAVWAMVAAAETRVYRTEARGGEMREVAGNFWSDLPQGNANTVDLDAAAADHPFTGLGVSIPESSCWLLSRLPAEKRAEILRTVWTADGAGLSVARLQIGSSDYSMHAYTYDDVAGDTELEHFSIDPDRRYVLPVVKEIQKINPDVTFFASPWSPPAWMKDNGNIAGGRMLDKYFGAYANYLVKYVQAYAKEGVSIAALTTQNEPEAEQSGMSPTCLWSGEQEKAFIVNHLAPGERRSVPARAGAGQVPESLLDRPGTAGGAHDGRRPGSATLTEGSATLNAEMRRGEGTESVLKMTAQLSRQ